MNDWIPQDYELPTGGGGYSKIEAGDNRFRVLSKPIMGRLYFNKEEKPVRVKSVEEVVPSEIGDSRFGGKQKPSHFRTFVVWDYQKESVSILEISKNSILEPFSNQLKEEGFENPTKYDIIITKTGSGKDTKYTFRAGKEKPITKDIVDEFEQTPVVLEKLFDYLGDPYEVRSGEVTERDKIDLEFEEE